MEDVANEIIAELRQTVARLHETQVSFGQAKSKYEPAAKFAQRDVKKHTSSSDTHHVKAHISDLDLDKLEEAAKFLAAAASGALAKPANADAFSGPPASAGPEFAAVSAGTQPPLPSVSA